MSTTLIIVLVISVSLGYLFYKIAVNIRENNLRKEKVDLIVNNLKQSKFRFVLIVRTNDRIYKAYEDNKLGKVGYHIYTKYSQFVDKYGIYIVDNLEHELMKIEKDTDSESMIGVDHPDDGHIGYLSFESVKRID